MLNLTVVFACGLVIAPALTAIADRAWVRTTRGAAWHNKKLLRVSLWLGLSCVFAFSFWKYGIQAVFWRNCAFASVMLVTAYVNQHTSIVPNVLSLPVLAVGILQSTVAPPGLASSSLGVLIGGGGLWCIAAIHFWSTGSEGLGMGVIKLQAAIGAWLGWKLMLVALVIATMVGSVSSIAVIVRQPPVKEVPFGIYQAIGGVLATLAGEALLKWYMSFL